MSAALGETIGTTEWTVSNTLGIPNPKVMSVEVSEQYDEIYITAENARLIRWIADGEQIAVTTTADCQNGTLMSPLSLDRYSDKIGSYVRAEIFGDGGILYTQAFVLDYDGAPEAKDFSHFIDYGKLVSGLRESLIFVFNVLPFGAVLWKLMTGKWYQL